MVNLFIIPSQTDYFMNTTQANNLFELKGMIDFQTLRGSDLSQSLEYGLHTIPLLH